MKSWLVEQVTPKAHRVNPTHIQLTPLEPQSRFGDKPVKFQIVCPQNGTAVLKGLTQPNNNLATSVALVTFFLGL